MRIYIIRHGETRANIDCIIQGWSDSPLTPYGEALAEASGRGMRGIRFDRCISSPLGRAMQTAGIVLKASGNDTAIETDERLREINLGDWEQQKLEDVNEAMNAYFRDTSHFATAPNGEGLNQVCARTQAVLTELAASGGEGNCLVVTHGCAYRAMLNGFYGDEGDFWHGRIPPNCAVSLVEAKDGACRLLEDDRLYFDPADVEGYHEGKL
ncbi:MAG: histidine phosphatase family protein [Clostridia bacterium]|nr:histidine phosphatase family protein [Clostridia bacterium]